MNGETRKYWRSHGREMGLRPKTKSSQSPGIDRMSPAQRSYCMSRVKGGNTTLERVVRSELHKRGLRFRKHPKDLPGRPDIVFRSLKIAIFLDGNFWHGYRFARWEHEMKPFWREKIRSNIARDRRNFARLRRSGWRVIRLWEHQVRKDLVGSVDKIVAAVRSDGS